MLETILLFLAAFITIFCAGLLVRRQHRYEQMRKELVNQCHDSLENMISEVEILTDEIPEDTNLSYLEKKIDAFNKSLQMVQSPSNRRRKQYGKPQNKRCFAND